MKKLFLSSILFFQVSILLAQSPEISHDLNGDKIIKGFITKEELVKDSAFGWFAQNQKNYVPEQNAVQAFKKNKDSINIIAFGGTWCDDTKSLLPKFFVLLDSAGFSQDRITLLGVDRNKKTIQHLSEAFEIINVPTFIIMKNGKEVGRVVEYGKYGMVDKELGEIIDKAGVKKN